MRRRLWLLNLLLVCSIAFAGWEIRLLWLALQARHQEVLGKTVPPLPAPPLQAAAEAAKVQAASYLEVASAMLFSRDRNPTVVVETPPPKPVPAFPLAYGMLDLGSGPTVFLTPPGKEQKGFRVGDTVGEFKLAAVQGHELVFEWDGQQFRKTIEELRPKEAAPAAAAAQPQAGVVPPARQHSVTPQEVVVESIRPKEGGPGLDIGGEVRACEPGDTSPAGTVMGGYKKLVSRTPFGNVCRWEPAR